MAERLAAEEARRKEEDRKRVGGNRTVRSDEVSMGYQGARDADAANPRRGGEARHQ